MRSIIALACLFVALQVQAQYYKQQIYTVEVPLSKTAVWDLWTTEAGITSFFSPAAKIGSAVGEPFEVLIDTSAAPGNQGNEGCVITQYQPEEKIAFQWVAPPKFADERSTKMEVFLQLESPSANRTKVTLAHIGWKEGGQWDDVFAYFEKAWPWVMDAFEKQAYRVAYEPYDFVVGTWTIEGTQDYERWEQETKQLTGSTYSIEGADTTVYETFTLQFGYEDLFFTPITNESDEEPFRVTDTGKDFFVLTRRGEDFPERITYRKTGTKTMTATLEGKREGKDAEIIFSYQKVD